MGRDPAWSSERRAERPPNLDSLHRCPETSPCRMIDVNLHDTTRASRGHARATRLSSTRPRPRQPHRIPGHFSEAANATRTLSAPPHPAPDSLDLNMDSVGTIRPLTVAGAQPTSSSAARTQAPAAPYSIRQKPGDGEEAVHVACCLDAPKGKREGGGWERPEAGGSQAQARHAIRRSPPPTRQATLEARARPARPAKDLCCFARSLEVGADELRGAGRRRRVAARLRAGGGGDPGLRVHLHGRRPGRLQVSEPLSPSCMLGWLVAWMDS